ncbi:GNAT family N-acetyltransferase [Kiloniella sp.]|uniref:GNAT family N-acetyltransferase n=1 Tax=Kiloniella sp. TaxID=1938587 RepID=UPI003A92A5DB
MEYLTLNDELLQNHHICCAISDKKCADGYAAKKDWLRTQFANGYRFHKGDARGKVFIEYVPIAHSWLPISGKNFMVINCFWVSGQFKGKGHGKALLQQCLNDARAMDGIVAVSSDKKRPFMTDPKFLAHNGFTVIDEAPPFFKLWGLKLNSEADFPHFFDTARKGVSPETEGITAYYSNTCPFTEFYTNNALREYATSKGIPLTINKISSQKAGHAMPIPWIINSVFYKGELVTLEMKAQRHLDKLIG